MEINTYWEALDQPTEPDELLGRPGIARTVIVRRSPTDVHGDFYEALDATRGIRWQAAPELESS